MTRRDPDHPALQVVQHFLSVDHSDYGSTASCDCGWAGEIRLEPRDAVVDGDLHLARVLARRVLGVDADTVAEDELLELLEQRYAALGEELGVVVDVVRHELDVDEDLLDEAAAL